MAAIDMARGGPHDDGSLDEPGAESPVRETVSHADKFNADQFQSVLPAREKALDALGDDSPGRHPNFIGGVSVHDWRSGKVK